MWFVVFQNRWPPGGPTTHRGRSFNDFEKKNWIVTGGSRTKFIHGTTCTRDDTRIISVKKRNVHWFTAPFKGQTNRITPSSYLWTEPSASLSLVKSANDYARLAFLWCLYWCPLNPRSSTDKSSLLLLIWWTWHQAVFRLILKSRISRCSPNRMLLSLLPKFVKAFHFWWPLSRRRRC